MLKIIPMIGIIVALFSLTTSALQAYDSHHPDPMSILNGHVHHARHAKTPPKDHNATRGGVQPWRMYKRTKEGKYVIKPEPYSLTSKKSDPELLGPQRTLSVTPAQTAAAAVPSVTTSTASVVPPSPEASEVMSRDECIGLIGQEKFDSYVQKYGGEKGALHRCLILKRTRG